MALLVLGSASAAPAATKVYAMVNSETAIYPGEDFMYSIVVEGGGRPSKIDISPLAQFRPRNAGSRSTVNIVNNRQSVAYSENYVLTAGQVGTMRLPGVTVVVDGETFTTNAVDVTISAAGTTDRMALELVISDKQCYVGQPLVMTAKWTITARVEQGAFEVPVFKSDDFYLEDVSDPANVVAKEQTVIHGVPVTVTEERHLLRGMEAAVLSFRKVLIPKHAGRIRLEPLSISANMAVGRERSDDLFYPYRIKYQRVSVQSNAIDLDVQPLPETGKPTEFYGLIGPYTISASATPTKVNVGDPITLTIRIGGNPYLKPVQWPALERVPELAANFRIPTEKASPVLEGGAASGSLARKPAAGDPSATQSSALGGACKVFTQTIRANSGKVTRIPAIPLAYFDPARGAYAIASTDPIKLDVAPAKMLTNVDVQGTASSAPINREVEAIRKGLSANYYGLEVLENQSASVLSWAAHPACAALWSIPFLALVASAVVKLAGRTSPEALARRRRRRAASIALAQLKQVSAADPGHKHELMLAAMKGYLGDRFDKIAASLTADDCHRIIMDGTGDAATAAKYKGLIDTCEAARYSRVEGVPPSNRGQDARDTIGPDQVQAAAELIQSVEKAKPVGADPHVRPLKGRHRGLPLLVLLALAPLAKAAPVLPRAQLDSLLQEANAAFQGANAAANPEAARPLYDKAILLYEKLIDQGGIHNARLYYNLANAYLLKEDLGRAILNYRRAEKLDRSDLNIQKNLTFARSRRVDRVETSTQRRVLETLFFWHYDFSGGTKFLLASVFFAALCVALTLMIWRGRGPAAGTAAVLSGVLLLALLLSLVVQTRHEAATRPGVITAAEIVARQGDGPNYPPSFKDPLHTGMEFDLIEHRPGWLHIRLSNNTDAWVPDDSAALV